jgi:hypothetical protein
MAGEPYDPGANSVMAVPGRSTDDTTYTDPGGATPQQQPVKILDTSFQRVPTNEQPAGSVWGGVSTFLRALDEGAGFDTTAVANTPPPPRADNPWATAIGQDLAKAAGVVGGMAKGLSFGLAPRLDRAIATPGQQLDELPQAKFEANSPELQTGAEIVGALPTAAIGEGALTRLIPAATRPGIVGRALDIGGQTTRGGIIGGTAGAGMNEADPVAGGLAGATAGAAIPLGLGAAGLIGRPLIDAVTARLVPGEASRQAAAKIAQAFNRDMITADQARDALARLGPLGGLIDAGGANVTGLGEAMASQPGTNRQIAKDFLETRMEGAPTRINAAINAATGNPANFHATMNNLADLRSTNAAPLYEQAFSKPAGMTDNIKGMLDDPVAQQGLKEGLEIQRIANSARIGRGEAPLPTTDPAIQYDANGVPRIVGVPNMRSLDAVKQGMDAIIEAARSDVTGQVAWTPKLREIDGLRRAWVSALDQNNPEYAAARAAWAGPSEARDAMEMGRNILSNDPEVTAETVARLSDGNKDFFRAGVARALKDRVDATQEGADATRKIFGNTLIRNKIAAGFGDDATFNQFRSTMENEGTFAQTRNEVLKNSATARRIAAQQDVDLGTPLTLLASGHPLPAAVSLLRQGARANPAMDTDPVRAQIAQQLFSQPGQQQASPYFQALQSAQSRLMTPWVRVPAGITGAIQAAQPPPRQPQRGGLLGQ